MSLNPHLAQPPIVQDRRDRTDARGRAARASLADRPPARAGPRHRRASGMRVRASWSAPTTSPRRPSTNSRCGRPRRSIRQRIDLELGWAAAIGMNTMRVFLHDLAYQQDPQGFLRPRRSVPRPSPRSTGSGRCWCCSTRCGIRSRRSARSVRRGPACTTPDGCRAPARWRSRIPTHWPRLETYVKAVVGRFKDDARVLAWDVWNEVDNPERAGVRQPRAEEQEGARARAAAAGLRVGARGRRRRSR